MAHRKAGGTAKNLNDSNPQYLGVKLYAGETAKPGAIIIRQRGTKFVAGKNTKLGKDHTVFAVGNGKVKFTQKTKVGFDKRNKSIKVVDVV
jgi:large subunit ribosomal protein L27